VLPLSSVLTTCPEGIHPVLDRGDLLLAANASLPSWHPSKCKVVVRW